VGAGHIRHDLVRGQQVHPGPLPHDADCIARMHSLHDEAGGAQGTRRFLIGGAEVISSSPSTKTTEGKDVTTARSVASPGRASRRRQSSHAILTGSFDGSEHSGVLFPWERIHDSMLFHSNCPSRALRQSSVHLARTASSFLPCSIQT
jgi:hypothetical protein